MKKNILVFPCGSEIGLEIHNALKWSAHINLFGGSSVSNHGKYVYLNYIEDIPDVNEPAFIEVIDSIIRKYNIDFIFPAHDSVALVLAKNSKQISCSVIGSSFETNAICRSKRTTYEYFANDVAVPTIYNDLKEIAVYPVFLKPDVGQGSKGVYKAQNIEEVRFYLKMDPTLMVLEYLPGKEYTVDCFTDRNKQLLFSGARERNRISNGISVGTFPVEDSAFRDIAIKINEKLDFRGAWFVQLKVDHDGQLTLLEIAPRIAGSMALHRNLGINFELLSIFDAMGLDLDVSPNKFNITLDRALCNKFIIDFEYSHVYIDLDDTIIFEGNINSTIMAYLYQCINKGIQIHLLSRHRAVFDEDVVLYLEKMKIFNIFDSIIDVADTEGKNKYILETSAIFIDDSFSERQDVKKMRSIPVFEVSSVESLIDWRIQ